MEWPVLSTYDSDHLTEISMPVGGIGTGFFSLGGRGALTDWQIMGRPHRGWRSPYCHLLLQSRTDEGDHGGPPLQRLHVLEGDLADGLGGDSGRGRRWPGFRVSAMSSSRRPIRSDAFGWRIPNVRCWCPLRLSIPLSREIPTPRACRSAS